MSEIEQKRKASSIVIKAMMESKKEMIDPYISIGAFIDETIRELSKQNEDEKIARFLESIAEKVRLGIYSKKK
tara:strand:- start:170 stop:388 length:219 start_codon:yes stop_codon:yes gene_type:complete